MSDQVEIPDINDLPDMQEAAEFTPVVKLLTIETPVLGYDGTNINPANWQAKALADRTQWLRDRLLNLSTRLVLSVNGKTGNVVVTYADAGADAAGTADGLMTAHLTALDPHAQYFDETRGDVRYVQRTLANQSNGWLQLDAAGKIPAAMLQTLASRYVVVANQAERLALASSANLTICAQADIDQLFYLNGGANPAVSANWVAGQSATVSGVSSVFGRTGAVTAQAGDYDADKITETATRKFATPTEKTAWNAKQVALVSGTNIRTLFGNSLLGSGNLAPTPAQMGAAAATHTHTTADITDYTQKTQQLITASLEAGQGVTLGQNPVNGKTIISASGGGSGGGGYIVVDRTGATAGQNHSFNFSPHSEFDLTAYALKEVSGAINQNYIVDDFNLGSENKYNSTNSIVIDGEMRVFSGGVYTPVADGIFYSTSVINNGEPIDIKIPLKSLVPVMTSNNTPVGYIVSQSSFYDPNWMGWKAFDGVTSGDASRWSATSTPAPHWLSIQLPANEMVDSYSITARQSVSFGGSPIDFEFQGSNDGVQFNTLDSRAGIIFLQNEKKSFKLRDPARFSHYRLYITRFNSARDACTINELQIFGTESRALIRSGDRYYTSHNGVISEVPTPISKFDVINTGFYESGVISSADVLHLTPFDIISSDAIDISVANYPDNQIAIQKSLLSAAAWGQINSTTLTATQTNSGFVRVAVTRDLINWHVWRGGTWVDIGTLSADTVSATKLIADGMTPSDLNGINAAGWAQLFVSNNGVPDYIAFAFALDISDPATDVATIDRLTLNVNESSRWMLQTAAQVEISWRTDSVTFRTVTAGNYKLAYQIP
ncbi:discoidin domain-containing protein [Pectobacterium aroidearum]|uniref:discoidin domain-containing protein n=1 Tax=Pectobacterium aroidearum TaxID=1201031 RepID=UPI0021148644|nr:discoidin domain-containing protein [Pectobacterium aroidearum]UUE37978.1 discoidin domain-containing protein [Pectobacterium aroidearum]UUE42353.1 discoidin domain-containing protein [Pectobacterium aroidearum]